MTSGAGMFGVYRGRRALVTGASGFIGRWVGHALSEAGAEVFLAGRDAKAVHASSEACGYRGRVCVADLSKAGEFRRLHAEVKPAVTFNLAGYGVDREERDEELAAALNTRLVAEIAEVIPADSPVEWSGLRLIHAGSAFEYGVVEGLVTEESPATPSSLYGQTKLAGTKTLAAACEKNGLRGVTARFFTVYGAGEHAGRLLPSLVDASKTGAALPMTGGYQQRDFTYVEDVAEGLLRLGLASKAPAVVNLATGKLTSVRDFVLCAAELLGLKPEQLQLGAIPYRADEVQQGAVDTTRVRKLLGWAPSCGVRDGIRRTIGRLGMGQ